MHHSWGAIGDHRDSGRVNQHPEPVADPRLPVGTVGCSRARVWQMHGLERPHTGSAWGVVVELSYQPLSGCREQCAAISVGLSHP